MEVVEGRRICSVTGLCPSSSRREDPETQEVEVFWRVGIRVSGQWEVSCRPGSHDSPMHVPPVVDLHDSDDEDDILN
jgi:hypothetical protein